LIKKIDVKSRQLTGPLNLIWGFETTSKHIGLDEGDQHSPMEQLVAEHHLSKESNYADY